MLLHSCLSPISAEDDPVYLSHYRVLHLEYANIVCSKEVIPFAVTVELEQFHTKRAWFHPPYECMIDSLTYDRSKVVFALKLRKSRKAKAVGVKKTKGMQKLDTQFQCPFCGHGTSVECRIDKKIQIGEAFCWNCLERFCTQIHALTEPIDIYAEWIDECERANNS
ncbi:hypothetical protein CUMW_152340 [Citrus unshiu]|uniref:Transcription elongation factor 1 homolog n=2 Tax=Citrus TaxID=2706 RepID=A0A2H5PNF5_CITUN|nr:hypothetical protein CUMW_152340 [Citrus unshiu]